MGDLGEQDDAEESGAGGSDAAGAGHTLDVSTAKRPAIRRRGQRGRRPVAQSALALLGALLLVSIAASLFASDGQTFSPINGLGVLGQLPLQPDGFGDNAALGSSPTATSGMADWPSDGSADGIAAINGQTHKPTVTP